MSFLNVLKDHTDVLNNTYDTLLNQLDLKAVIQQSSIFIFSTLKLFFNYLLTFQWVKDFTCFPVRIPEITQSILNEHLVTGGVSSGMFPETSSPFNLFTFLQPPVYRNNKLFIGFLNSFFLCLPISVVNLIHTRRLLVQGIPAGIASGLGVILGQWWLFTSVVCGFRIFVIPWFSSGPVPYLTGLYLVVTIIYDMTHQRSFVPIPKFETGKLVRIFLLSFALAWTEQSCIFSHLNNFTLDLHSSLLQSHTSNSFLSHLSYSIGLLIGSTFFIGLFGWLSIRLFRFAPSVLGMFYSTWLIRVNRGLLVLIMCLAVTSIPYYGLDYLIAKPLGFLSQDQTLSKTILSPRLDSRWGFSKPDRLDCAHLPELMPFQRTRYLLNNPLRFDEKVNFSTDYVTETEYVRKKNRTPERKIRAMRDLGRSVNEKFGAFFKNWNPLSNYNKKVSLDEKKDLAQGRSRTNRKSKPLVEFDEKLDSTKSTISPVSDDTIFTLDLGLFANWDKYFQPSVTVQAQSDYAFNSRFRLKPGRRLSQAWLTKRYLANPVYKSLLKTDIDFFINRQPSRFKLSPVQEANLVENRTKLAKYYNTLHAYDKLDIFQPSLIRAKDLARTPYKPSVKQSGPKRYSYANHVYNQQFKGSMSIVRRLFSLKFSAEKSDNDDNYQRSNARRVLKYDQPLFREKEINTKHEELPQLLDFQLQTGSQATYEQSTNKGNRFAPLASATSETLADAIASPPINGERVVNQNKTQDSSDLQAVETDQEETLVLVPNGQNHVWPSSKEFVYDSESTPFYGGWDQSNRRFVLTNSLLPRVYSVWDVTGQKDIFNPKHRPIFPKVGADKTPSWSSWTLIEAKYVERYPQYPPPETKSESELELERELKLKLEREPTTEEEKAKREAEEKEKEEEEEKAKEEAEYLKYLQEEAKTEIEENERQWAEAEGERLAEMRSWGQQPNVISFTTWPLERDEVDKSLEDNTPYKLFFKGVVNPKNHRYLLKRSEFLVRAEHVFGVPEPEEDMLQDIIEIHQPSTYPPFLEPTPRRGVIRNITPSNLGGFVWPGHKNLKFKFVVLKTPLQERPFPPHQKDSN